MGKDLRMHDVLVKQRFESFGCKDRYWKEAAGVVWQGPQSLSSDWRRHLRLDNVHQARDASHRTGRVNLSS